MDELKVKLSTKFMRNIVSKLIATAIKKKYGYKIDIQLNEIDVKVINGEAHLHTDVEVVIDNNEFTKIVKSVGLD